MGADEELAAISETVASEQPWSRLPRRVFLDAQAIVQWARFDILEEVVACFPSVDASPRFQVQDAASREAAGRLVSLYGGDRELYLEHLRHGIPNLWVDGPTPAETSLRGRELSIQQAIAIREFARTGVDRRKSHPKRHLGEAEILAYIERVEQGSAFVSGDRDARDYAKDLGVAVAIHPMALAMGVIDTVDKLTQVWKSECDYRECSVAASDRQACQAHLECPSLSTEAADRGELDHRFDRGDRILHFGHKELLDLIAVLPA